MLYIVLAVSLTSPEVSYCTKPATMDIAQAQLSILVDWPKYHRGYTTPSILPATDPKAARAMAGYTIPASEAGNRGPVAAPPCRLFGSD